ncbi:MULTISPECIES: TraV family lipoprotein [Sphingobium]|jgi:conjugal transfer pilus assembly protein TraV|uniref:TraV family lipoprotein n=1 Tax=Sphingobium TaxID=165695 RepID=UPI000C6A9B81|nr:MULTISPECIES: TraV family lipoprotein [Sphingobium]MBS51110.1 conjugal transfer protein TraV [Sphingobium sp.]MCC4256140.1 TraV family lipoprotein [Sphingobium lactosutens]
MPLLAFPSASSVYRVSVPLMLLASLPACTAIGSVMSPYPEKFSCKNSDHGQCIHPERAYEDAVAGAVSRSDPKVTNDRKMLSNGATAASTGTTGRARGKVAAPYIGYRDSVYRELQGLVEAPVTPMLRPGRTIRTLILPYADRERPDRLYMPRYVYSILDKPQWVVGDYLVSPVSPSARVPVLNQVKAKPASSEGGDIPAPPQEEAQ